VPVMFGQTPPHFSAGESINWWCGSLDVVWCRDASQVSGARISRCLCSMLRMDGTWHTKDRCWAAAPSQQALMSRTGGSSCKGQCMQLGRCGHEPHAGSV
jgi:hypothetical protein